MLIQWYRSILQSRYKKLTPVQAYFTLLSVVKSIQETKLSKVERMLSNRFSKVESVVVGDEVHFHIDLAEGAHLRLIHITSDNYQPYVDYLGLWGSKNNPIVAWNYWGD